MSLSRGRILAVVRKELRDYRGNRSVLVAMAILPLVFLVQPLVAVLALPPEASSALAHEHALLYMLGIPTLVPVVLAASAIAGEREQGTLEPLLTTPTRSDELLIGKALAALLPSLVISYAVYVLYLVIVEVLAAPGVASALIQLPDLIAQVVFTPLLAGCSIWVGICVSTRASDVRVAQQVGLLANLPVLAVVVLVALDVIEPSPRVAVLAGAALVLLNVAGWRISNRLFDRERLVTGTR